MDKDVIKKFKSIMGNQIGLQEQLRKMNGKMLAAIKGHNVASVKTVSEEIDHVVEQMDTLERDRIELLLPYIKDKIRLKRISSFIEEFPKDEISGLKELVRQLKEISLQNFEQSRVNQILLNEAVYDIRKGVEIINMEINRPIKYSFDGEKQAALPVHLVNQKC